METDSVAVRDRLDGDMGAMKISQAIHKLQEEIRDRTVRRTFGGHAGLGDRGASNEY
jgi:threonyl-tRNA synthetase